jgi:TonB family protein
MTIEYLLEANLFLIGFYLAYRLLFRNETFFNTNRVYLLCALIAAPLLPLIEFQSVAIAVISEPVLLPEVSIDGSNAAAATSGISAITILFWAYMAGIAFFAIRFVMGIVKITRLMNGVKRESENGYAVVPLAENQPTFSFFKWLFCDPKSRNEQAILEHEMVHIRQWHSADVVLAEIVGIIFWYNPILIFYKRSIKEVHEFIADEAVIHNHDKSDYSELLFSHTFGVSPATISSSFFNRSLLKRRIIMMNRNKSVKRAGLKYLMIMPVAGMLLFFAACTKEEATTVKTKKTSDYPAQEEKVYDQVEVMPEFPGGMQAMMTYLGEKIKYPESAKKEGTEGKVFISFVVNSYGKVTDVSVLKSVTPELDNVAKEVVQQMPDWTPGKQDGKSVSVKFTLPISFKMADE